MSMKQSRWLWILGLGCAGILLFLISSLRREEPTKPQQKPRAYVAAKTSMPAALRTPIAQEAWDRVMERKRVQAPSSEEWRRIALQQIVDDKLKSLKLSEEENKHLIEDLELVDDLRNELERSMVQATPYDDGTLKLHIPAYPETGRDLKEFMQALLADDFTMAKSDEIMNLAGSDISQRLNGFGTMDQSFTASKLDTDHGNIRVTWTLKLDQVPSKEALIATGGVWGGGSGTTVDSLSSFDSGSFSVLGPSLRKNFGENK
jgi:hypothetical protein